jgi:hypothetical protein
LIEGVIYCALVEMNQYVIVTSYELRAIDFVEKNDGQGLDK